MLAALASRYRDVPSYLRLERQIEVAGLALGALALLLLGLVVLSSLRSTQVERITPSADAIAVASAFRDESVDARGSFEIRSRPIFWRSRRPERPLSAEELAAAAQDSAADLKPLKFKVAGVFGAGSNDAGFIAVMKDEVRRIRLGESIEGWTVERIEPTTIELAGGGETRLVSMERRPVVAPDRVRGAGTQQAAASAASNTSRNEGATTGAPAPAGGAPADARSTEPPRLSLGGAPPGRAPQQNRDRNQSR
ncbi:MAG: hypothetical protein AAGL66_04235 [Pseudomonadota bacterium]